MNESNLKVLDGGLSTLLIQEFNHPEIKRDPLWGSRLIVTSPQDVVSAHLKFLTAGADLIETCTYQATVEGLMKHCNVTPSEAVEILKKGVGLCIQARDIFWQENKHASDSKPQVLGSIGPYGAFLADRSEYSGNYVDSMSTEEMKNWHRLQVEPIQDSGADVIAFETFTTIKEPSAVVDLMKEYPYSKYYISFNCMDNKTTYHNDKIEDAVREILKIQPANTNLIGLGINCTKPVYIEDLLKKMKSEFIKMKRNDVNIIAYPDGGSDWLSDGSWDSNNIKTLWSTNVPKWLDAGAHWIGGCCMTTNDDIAQIRKIIDVWKNINNQ